MNQQDPTAGINGLQVKAVIPDKFRDVFDFVLHQWLAAREAEQGDGPVAAIAIPLEEQADVKPVLAFIEKARQLFTTNKVIGQDFLSSSPSLRFQDGTVLVFCDVPNLEMGGTPGSLDISKHHPNREGKGLTTSTAAWGVTGNP